MPFYSRTSPRLSLGLLQAQLLDAGFEARSFYLNLALARQMGEGLYDTIALSNVQISEWLFAGQAWDDPPPASTLKQFLSCHDLPLPSGPGIDERMARLERCREEIVPAFLEHCLKRLEKAAPIRVVAFSCSYFQTLSGLALGRRIKERYPDARVVYGGACFHDEMGEELIRKVPWIDAVSTGEADDVVVPLFRSLSRGDPPANLQGICFREPGGQAKVGPPARAIDGATFRSLPTPIFDDFFDAARAMGYDADPAWRRALVVPFESSRGCWWGHKHHCTFCGLNANGMAFRTRAPEQVIETLRTYRRRHSARTFHAADNILAMSSFRDLIPELTRDPPASDIEIFFHVKANCSREQIEALARAGITDLGPGIESLNTHLLRLIRKGVSGIQNVFFLKCCLENGIRPRWSILMRVPGESAADYVSMAYWIPRLHHLPPPSGAGKIQIHRFSPYFINRERWNTNLRPENWYSLLYPADHVDLGRVAYSFDAEWKDVLDDDCYRPVVEAVEGWRGEWASGRRPQLRVSHLEDDGMEILDAREGRRGLFRLDAAEAAVYRAIAAPARTRRVAHECRGKLEVNRIVRVLDEFVEAGLALYDEGLYLGLATERHD